MPAKNSRKGSAPRLCIRRAPSGKQIAYATFDGRQVNFGPPGPEAQRLYQEFTARWLLNGKATLEPSDEGPCRVEDLVADFMHEAQQHYRTADGKLSGEVTNFRHALTPFLELLGSKPTADLSCNDLVMVRNWWASQPCRPELDENKQPIPGTGKPYSRNYVNAAMRRVRFVCRWGTERNMVPGPVWASLSAFRSLTIGRGGLRETAPIEAVSRPVVDAILPHLPPTLQAAVELLWWSGMRAGELCNLRMRDVDRTNQVWLFRPATHKGTWKGRERVVRFGPRCREVIAPLLTADPDAYLFRPIDVVAERRTAMRAARKTKVQPSQVLRAKKAAARRSKIRDKYDVTCLRRAIYRACDQAGVERFGLHRLRHAAGTRLVLEVGDDAARLQLGHADGRMVRRYSRAAESVAGDQVAAQHA